MQFRQKYSAIIQQDKEEKFEKEKKNSIDKEEIKRDKKENDENELLFKIDLIEEKLQENNFVDNAKMEIEKELKDEEKKKKEYSEIIDNSNELDLTPACIKNQLNLPLFPEPQICAFQIEEEKFEIIPETIAIKMLTVDLDLDEFSPPSSPDTPRDLSESDPFEEKNYNSPTLRKRSLPGDYSSKLSKNHQFIKDIYPKTPKKKEGGDVKKHR